MKSDKLKRVRISPSGERGCFKSEGCWIPGCTARSNDDRFCDCHVDLKGSRAALACEMLERIALIRGELETLTQTARLLAEAGSEVYIPNAEGTGLEHSPSRKRLGGGA